MKKMPTINNLYTLEELRKKIIKKQCGSALIAIIVSLIIGLLSQAFEVTVIFFFLMLLLSQTITVRDVNNFKKAYKHLIILEIFKKVFTNVNFLPDKGLNYNLFKTIDVLDKPDRYTTNDYIKATYNNINFETADVHFEERHTTSKGRTYYTTMFQGQWYIFDFNKSFVSDVQIIDSNFTHTSRKSFFSKPFNKIQLEDMEFNNLFDTYAQNDLDAFYLLTPHVIQKLKTLKYANSGNLIFCFNNNKLHIGVNNERNSFEPNLYRPININEIEQQTLQEIYDIISFINYLDLDNTLFRKGV